MIELVPGKVDDSPLYARANRILKGVGLTSADLEGKRILDVGSGNRVLERYVKQQGMNADVISLDINPKVLRQEKTPGNNAVYADLYDLPFRDGSIDLLICAAVPIEGPLSQTVMDVYSEMLRVVKKDGEIRVSNPYASYTSGVGAYLYLRSKIGEVVIPKGNLLYLAESNWAQYDEEGLPIPGGVEDEGVDFWNIVYDLLDKEDQNGVVDEMNNILVFAFQDAQAPHCLIRMESVYIEGEESEMPFLVINKVNQEKSAAENAA